MWIRLISLLFLAALPGFSAELSKEQLAGLSARGRDLASRIRLEEACGLRDMPSPLATLDPDRWTAYFLGEEDAAGKRAVVKVFSCPAGKPEALAPAEVRPLPAELEVPARLLSGTLHQLGKAASEVHLVVVPEADGGASLYRMLRRDGSGGVRLGQDYRLTYRPKEAEPFAFTRFHGAIYTLPAEGGSGTAKDSKTVAMFHNHFDLADPCETDVAAAILSGNVNVLILAANATCYSATANGNLAPAEMKDAPRQEGKGGPAQASKEGGLRAFSFEQSALDEEGRWVVTRSEGKEIYEYLCVYLDYDDGFSFQAGRRFRLDREGRARIVAGPLDQVNLKVRMTKDFKVARMPPGILQDLALEAKPSFLKDYQPEPETPETRLRRGWHLNHFEACERALQVLEPLYQAQPSMKGLAFEVAFAYNALKRMDRALPVLEQAAKLEPGDLWVARELAYTYLHTGRFQEAVAAYHRSLALVPEKDPTEKSEEAINLSIAYEQLKDTVNRDAWRAKARAWAPPGSPVAQFFDAQDKQGK